MLRYTSISIHPAAVICVSVTLQQSELELSEVRWTDYIVPVGGNALGDNL